MGSVVIVVLIVVLAVVLIAAATAAMWLRRRTRPTRADGPPDAARSSIAPAAPMVGLEAALDSVTDRSGRRLRDKLEAEAAVVDDLRVSDDTGPLLRRALDRVEHADHPGDHPSERPTGGPAPSTTDT